MALGEGMTLDDLLAAPLTGANRHALECDESNEKWAARRIFSGACDMCSLTQEELDAYNKMRADMSIPLNVNINDIVAASERVERQRQLEYDERVVATPMNLTWEDLAENHAAGLPVMREHIVRCKDCEFYQRNDRCGGALQCLNERFIYGKWGASVEPDFFCADGKPREVE